MPDLARLASWLRCPARAADLEPVDRLTLGCPTGHRHDVNRRGYVSLLGGGTKHIGDSADMLDARDTVLGGGAYAALTEAVASAASGGERIVDAGAGTGHYLRVALTPMSSGLALDLSPTAVARAVRSDPRIDGVVADTWRPLPLRNRVADVLLNVFAPRNLPEFARVLRPEGTLVVVVPRPDHLAELRTDGGMLDIPDDKADAVLTAADAFFALESRVHIHTSIALDATLRAALPAMGPTAHHGRPSPAEAPSATLSVDLLRLARRP